MVKYLLSLSFCLLAGSLYAQPVGIFNNGRLENAQELPPLGDGYMRLYLGHDLGWGSKELVESIQLTAQEMNRLYPDSARLQVEDLSARFGGPIENHGSHQNGLDVDLTYYRTDNLEHTPRSGREYYSPSLVVNGSLSPNFDSEKNWEMVKLLHKYGSINRIFMDQIIKRELCRFARSKGEFNQNIQVLRSIRHVNNHQDHLHVRLKCPAGAKACRDQAPPPAGPGC